MTMCPKFSKLLRRVSKILKFVSFMFLLKKYKKLNYILFVARKEKSKKEYTQKLTRKFRVYLALKFTYKLQT